MATHIIASPSAWTELSKFKDETDSNMSLVDAGTEAAIRTLLSVPVLVSNSMTDGTMLVLDKSTIVSVYGSVQLATSTDYYFDSDSIGVRATWRFGQKIADRTGDQADRGDTRQLADLGAGVFEFLTGACRGGPGLCLLQAQPHLKVSLISATVSTNSSTTSSRWCCQQHDVVRASTPRAHPDCVPPVMPDLSSSLVGTPFGICSPHVLA